MIKNFNKPICEIDGTFAVDQNGKQLIIAQAVINALLAPYQQDQNLEGTEKVKRYELAKKIQAGDPVDVSVEELALIKQLIGRSPSPVLIGQVYDWVDDNQSDDK